MNKDPREKVKKEIEIAMNLYKSGDNIAAENKAKLLIKKYPNIFILYNILGLALSNQKKIEEAITCYKKLIKIKPDFAIAYNNLGNILKNKGEKKEAQQYFEKAIKIEPSFALALNNLGNLLRDENKFEQAIECFKSAIKHQPKLLPVYNNLGSLYQNQGKFDEAHQCFRSALKINPNFCIAHRQISISTKYSLKNKHFEEMKNKVLEKNLSNDQIMDLSFALGKAFDDVKDFEKSFQFYLTGNKIKRQSFEYSIQEDINYFQNIKNTFSFDLFKNIKNSGVKDSTPIFVLGMPRSGTSLVEQILSSHSDVYGAGELGDLSLLINKNFSNKGKINFSTIKIKNEDNLQKIGSDYINNIKRFNDSSKHITDKAINNFQFIGLIKLCLPNAKIIHCVRDSRDTCLSIFKNFFAGFIPYAYDLKEMGLYFNLYKDLMNHWNNVLPGFICNISYENLVMDQKENTKKILNFCNLKWDDNCMQFHKSNRPIVTASLAQARRPIYKDSLKAWERYKSELKPLIEVLKF